ncbi:MAG: class I SAM-dependent methyltransferase [Anaerolineae bacterium]|jgi:SAM-dependent methyltransferase|nr:class I SAM-dependent methyltransferase [Anaerolineae bacterium]
MKHDPGKTDWIRSFYESAVQWWGESWYDGENLQERLHRLNACVPEGRRTILELGAGTGETALFLAEHGYTVTAVDLSPANIALIQKAAHPAVRAVEGNFLTVPLAGTFDAVCLFETFGMGSDADQHRLLERIRQEWLAQDGCVLMDVYHPFGPIRQSGTQQTLDRLPQVPGSVDMTEYSYYDGFTNRWIDIWEPIHAPEERRVQSIRCYTPADLLLLLQGTGLQVSAWYHLGKRFDDAPELIHEHNRFDDFSQTYTYSVVLRRDAA